MESVMTVSRPAVARESCAESVLGLGVGGVGCGKGPQGPRGRRVVLFLPTFHWSRISSGGYASSLI